MKWIVVVAAAVVVVVAAIALVLTLRGGEATATQPIARSQGDASLRLELDREKRALASCRGDVDDLERELNELRRTQGLPPSTRKGSASQDAAPDKSRAREPASGPNDARTKAWIDHVAGDLALTDKQRAQLVDIANWAADQRNALKAKAERDQLDSNAVRAEIAEQRQAYEAKMKALLTADEWQAFDQTQGIDRRPPTFARMPDILGDQGAPLRPPSDANAGNDDAGNPGPKSPSTLRQQGGQQTH